MSRPKYDEQKGLVFNIQRFSIHDGPGIRTTVFMKSCPLGCRWCSNPESMKPFPEIMTRDVKCIKCGKCVQACPLEAITFDQEQNRRIDRAKCDLCLKCADVCPTGAISVVGRYLTVPEVMAEIESDKLFYQNSGGGATVSGGEPLSQWRFVRELLKVCKQKSIHTSLDTSGYAPWPIMEKVLEYVDLVLYDIKHIDPQKHRQGTGRSNIRILNNARQAASRVRLWVRVPVIPGYNDSVAVLRELGEFARSIGAEKVSLLPYHEWGRGKYEQIGREYPRGPIEAPSPEYVQQLGKIIEGFDLPVTIGN